MIDDFDEDFDDSNNKCPGNSKLLPCDMKFISNNQCTKLYFLQQSYILKQTAKYEYTV